MKSNIQNNKVLNLLIEKALKKGENKEATDSGSSGGFVGPLTKEGGKSELGEMMQVINYKKIEKILDVIKEEDPESYSKIMDMIMNTYDAFDYDDVDEMLKTSKKKDVHSKVKSKMADVEKSKKGNLTIDDLIEKHLKKTDREEQLEKKIRTNLRKGTKVEMEHTDDKEVAKKIAMDHLYEDLEYYTKLKKMETKEATGSGSSGSYETTGAWAKSTKKKDWRGRSKTQIPGGKFVTVKKRCKHFPYCNQGDIKALKIYENESVKNVINKIAKKYNVSETVIKAVIQNEMEINRNKSIN
jgi:hypothetical protein